jgi:phosphoglycerate dehydrogenase-like enzyme
MGLPRVVVTARFAPEMREAVEEVLGQTAEVAHLSDLEADGRGEALAAADAVLAWNPERELDGPRELPLLASAGLVQLLSAGAEHVPFDRIPPQVPVASNVGAYAEPMAEHILAMALALAKRLPQNHAALGRGEWDQRTPNRWIRGSVVGILGFGGIGRACADLFEALGARIHAINRSGHTDRSVEFIGTPADLDAVLASADILVVSAPLTRHTRGLIGARELSLMKPDATLVNVARGAIVDEDALYEHLRDNPGFSAGLDAWWREPARRDSFATRRPLLDLPNVLGSPHNSAIVPGALVNGARRAAENVVRHLRGERVTGVVDRADYPA